MKSKYLLFESIKSSLPAWRYTRCRFSQQELLATAADIFVGSYDAQRGEARHHACFCLRQAARQDGYALRKDVKPIDFIEFNDLHGGASGGEQEAIEALDRPDQLRRQREQVETLISRCCPRIQQFWGLVRAGLERDEAAAQVGVSQVEVTRVIRLIQSKLGLAREAIYYRRDVAGEQGQMNLFAAA